MHKYRRRVALLLVPLGTFSACDGETATVTTAAPTTAAPTTTAPTTAAPTTTAPTTAAPTTTAPTTAAPTTTAPTTAELEDVIDALYQRQQELLDDPENADVTMVCTPAPSECFERLTDSVQKLADLGRHTEDVAPNKVETILQVTDLYDVTTVDSNVTLDLQPGREFLVQFRVEPRTAGGRLVDADGNTIAEVGEAPDPEYETDRTIVRWPTDKELPWRFAS